jgi:molecular chaperone DnaK (HSP70)
MLTPYLRSLDGTFIPFIRRNSPLPANHTRIVSTAADNQPTVLIQVYEGEYPTIRANNLLGEFELLGIPPAARGIPSIEVTFQLDENGILRVSAQDKRT